MGRTLPIELGMEQVVIPKGIPVRRFSKNELLDLVLERFEVVLWRQFKYVKESKVKFFAAKYNVPPVEILHGGVSQFVVLQPKP